MDVKPSPKDDLSPETKIIRDSLREISGNIVTFTSAVTSLSTLITDLVARVALLETRLTATELLINTTGYPDTTRH